MLLSECVTLDELGGGQYQQTIHPKPIAYNAGGILTPINSDWADNGPERPHIVTAAPFFTSIGPEGARRVHPTREIDRYFEIGRPWAKIGGTWQVAPMNPLTRNGNRLVSTNANYNLYILHGGHFVKLAILLKGGFVPAGGQFAFPVDLVGFNRQGGIILDGDVPVMRLQPFTVEDYGVEDSTMPIDHSFVQLGGQWYVLLTLPDISHMARPLIDPTLILQPDAAAGIDTRILSSSADLNYGIKDSMLIGTGAGGQINRGMIKFDISSLPAGATLTSATLALYCTGEANAADEDVGAHKSLVQWYEGDKDGGTTTIDGSTWNNRNHIGAVAWTGGAGGVSGTEWTAVATATTAITTTGQFFNWNVLADVNSWYGGATNYGWWLINTDEVNLSTRKTFSSSDEPTAAQRPKLTIVYTLPTPT